MCQNWIISIFIVYYRMFRFITLQSPMDSVGRLSETVKFNETAFAGSRHNGRRRRRRHREPANAVSLNLTVSLSLPTLHRRL